MKLAALGEITIKLTPLADNPEIMAVDVIAEKRKDPVVMMTNKDETPDQFATRIKGMLRSLLNGEERKQPIEDKAKEPTWEEQKAALKEKNK